MSAPKRPSNARRQGSHYHTFLSTHPRKRDTTRSSDPHARPSSSSRPQSRSSEHHETPLPTSQLVVLAVIALAEQTALNSISPYLPDMASTFPEVDDGEVGVYVGLIASAFALAQFTTNFFWGWLSDRIGRKPVVMLGTILTAACFVAFGFCQTLWQAILVQALMGLVNGNQGVVSTCLGEITDRSNQSKAFQYLPVVYGIGGITGPIIGGLLVTSADKSGDSVFGRFPYLLPNLFSAAVLVIDFVVTAYYLQESMEDAKDLPPFPKRVGNIFVWLWQFTGFSQRPTYTRPGSSDSTAGRRRSHAESRDDVDASETSSEESPDDEEREDAETHGLRARDVLDRDTFLILVTYFIFQLCNIAYNSLYPIFAQATPPTGRNLTPQEIGISLAFAGLVTIVFQISIFGSLRGSMGNKTTYRIGLAGFMLAFLLMPWIGYKDSPDTSLNKGNILLWVELAGVLTIKTVAAVGGLTSALLLVRDRSP